MFKLKIGTNTSIEQVIMTLDKTPRQAILDHDFDPAATWRMSGIMSPLSVVELDSTFAELGVQPDESIMLLSVANKDNA